MADRDKLLAILNKPSKEAKPDTGGLIKSLMNRGPKEEVDKDADKKKLMSVLGERTPSDGFKYTMDNLESDEKEFVLGLMKAPEVVNLVGLLMGQEAFDYFQQYEDPDVTIQLMPKSMAQPPEQSGEVQPMEGEILPPSQDATQLEAPLPSGPSPL